MGQNQIFTQIFNQKKKEGGNQKPQRGLFKPPKKILLVWLIPGHNTEEGGLELAGLNIFRNFNLGFLPLNSPPLT